MDVAIPKRAAIEALAGCLKKLDSAHQLPVDHFFAQGLYGRLCFMQAGDCVVSRVHKQQHITVALTGHCRVIGIDGSERDVIAPEVFVTEPGTQRALLILEDALWLTVHATEANNPEAMMDLLTHATYEEYLAALPAPTEEAV